MDAKVNHPLSIRELHLKPDATPQELVATFEVYVQTGASIAAEPLIEVIKRVPIGLQHLGCLMEGIPVGFRDQTKRGFPKDAAEYQKLGEFVSRKIQELRPPRPL